MKHTYFFIFLITISVTFFFSANGQNEPEVSFDTTIEGSDTICSTQQVCFINTSQNVDENFSFLWEVENGNAKQQSFSEIGNPVCFTFDEAGEFSVTLTAEAPPLEYSFDTVIVVKQTPAIDLDVTPSITMEPMMVTNFLVGYNVSDSLIVDFDDGTTTNSEFGAHTYEECGEYTIIATGYYSGCMASDSMLFTIRKAPPNSSFSYSAKGCAPFIDTLFAYTDYADKYKWTIDGNIIYEENPVYTFEIAGTYYPKLEAARNDDENYTYIRTDTVIVDALPDVRFTSSPDLVILPDQKVRVFNNTEDAVKYLWDFGDGITLEEDSTLDDVSPSHLYSEAGIYDITLYAWSEFNCRNSYASEEAVRVISEQKVVFPSAFSPNPQEEISPYYTPGSKSVTLFAPVEPDLLPIDSYHLRIFNRHGQLLFESNDPLKGWNGYYKGKLCRLGSYLWHVKGTFTNQYRFEQSGEVFLLR